MPVIFDHAVLYHVKMQNAMSHAVLHQIYYFYYTHPDMSLFAKSSLSSFFRTVISSGMLQMSKNGRSTEILKYNSVGWQALALFSTENMDIRKINSPTC